jgi:hypothetical protein
VTISEDEDTQVSHQPINGGDSSPAAAETDRS